VNQADSEEILMVFQSAESHRVFQCEPARVFSEHGVQTSSVGVTWQLSSKTLTLGLSELASFNKTPFKRFQRLLKFDLPMTEPSKMASFLPQRGWQEVQTQMGLSQPLARSENYF
jgi:hypothetical protein